MATGPGHASIRLVVAALLLLCARCAAPPPSAYVTARGGAKAVALSVGTNEAGEACTQDGAPGDPVVAISCGTWSQPSAHVYRASAGVTAASASAAGSRWRTDLDRRLDCAAPLAATVLGRFPAFVLACTSHVGGWPQVAVAADVNGVVWLGDGVRPALPAIERSIGVQAGEVAADAAAAQNVSAGLAAQRLAAAAFSSGDIGAYEDLIRAANRANLSGNFASAEAALRAAIALQERVQGGQAPGLARPLASLALQVSNQGRFAEARKLFDRGSKLAAAANQTDELAAPLLAHYQALDLFNRGKREEALAGLRRAEIMYAALLPPDALDAPPPATGRSRNLAASLDNQQILNDGTQRAALFGVIETRREQGRTLRQLGRTGESVALMASATSLAVAREVSEAKLTAYLYRSAAFVADAQGRKGEALDRFSASTAAFATATPGSRAYAETGLILAGQQAQSGQREQALATCRTATAVLRDAHAGTSPALLQPCLALYYADASGKGDRGQTTLADMFALSQLAQDTLTSRQISQASARLMENARDPKVAALIRKRDDESAKLSDLYEARDDLIASQRASAVTQAEVDLGNKIAGLLADQARTESELQAASPNYGQLVQQVVDSRDIFRALHPGEAFLGMTLAPDTGWVFLLRDGHMSAGPIDGGSAVIARLVDRVRASLDAEQEPPPPFDIAAAQELYRRVFGSIASGIADVHALSVAPSGPLLSVPFGIMLSGPARQDDLAGAPWLIRQMNIEHVPAAVNFVSLRRLAGTSRATRPWFGFGDFQRPTLAQAKATFPVASCGDTAQLFADLPPLPGAKVELNAVRQLIGAAPADELLGAAFTVEAVRTAPLNQYRVLHFATHALLPTDLRCQNEPALIASVAPRAANADGAMLTASDVQGLDLDADAVILSACNTGGPGGGGGESMSGLARSFFYAGARALLVTHWAVNDRAAAYLVALTMASLQTDPQHGLAGALALAQRQMLADAKGPLALQAHPFYWGALAVIGEGMGVAAPGRSVAGL